MNPTKKKVKGKSKKVQSSIFVEVQFNKPHQPIEKTLKFWHLSKPKKKNTSYVFAKWMDEINLRLQLPSELFFQNLW
jgi:hypothetical protein